MNSSTLRRLASDHAALHTSELPPHYLFAPSSADSSILDDLTQLTVLLTGPQGTPYASGLWKLHLKIPHDYPKNPPKASFRTKIWHPNVEESTGSVCVDTLKRDWEAKLTLRDVLITISCLLIQPNPDSALNATAGKLLQEDYESFARQAELMTSIHANIPASLKDAVLEAKRRGEDKVSKSESGNEWPRHLQPKSASTGVLQKRRPNLELQSSFSMRPSILTSNDIDMDSDTDSEDISSKENDPSLSPTPVTMPPRPNPRRPLLGKRPLSDLPTPLDTYSSDEEDPSSMTSSAQNIANNTPHFPSSTSPIPSTSEYSHHPQQKLVERNRSSNFANRYGEEMVLGLAIDSSEDRNEAQHASKRRCSGEEKENITEGNGEGIVGRPTIPLKAVSAPVVQGLKSGIKAGAKRNVSTASSGSGSVSSGKGKSRLGLRRL